MTDEQTAAAIVADSRNACDETAMEAAIVRALQAARKAPPGHIIDDAGVVRRVDTTGWNHADTSKPVPLPVYADGELWMIGEEAFTIVDGEVRIIYTYDHRPSWTSSGWVIRWGDGEIELNKCYANKDAAEAEKEGADATNS